jgi:hypothetical protein
MVRRRSPVRSRASASPKPQLEQAVTHAGELLGRTPELVGDRAAAQPRRSYDVDGHALYGPMSEQQPFRDAVQRVIDGANGHRLALLCSEADPRHCHRRLLLGKVLTEQGVALRLLLSDGSVHRRLKKCSAVVSVKPIV